MAQAAEIITNNVAVVRDRIANAAGRSGRDLRSIKLVAVTKYVDPSRVRDLITAGVDTLGESRPQELWTKAKVLTDVDVDWHLVGHLQRNKIRRTLPWVRLIHSVDSVRLAEAISEEAGRSGRQARVLLEVNVSGDASKHGFAPDELPAKLGRISDLDHLDVRGLMTMAHREGGPEAARRDFAQLRELRDRLAADLPVKMSLGELSMGMSGDFEEAIAEGATLVRVGSALFENLSP